MPLKKLYNLRHSTLGVWEITESEEELFRLCFLTEAEQLEFSTVHHPTKRKEFLAGRLVLKTLLEDLSQPFKGLIKDDCGKPFLIDQKYHISMSHCHPYAGAIVSGKHPVGIDIEQPHDKLFRIAPKFLSESEKVYANNDLIRHCVFWSAKEVLYKIYGRKKLTLNKELLIEFNTEKRQLTGHIDLPNFKESYSIDYMSMDGYIICYND